MPKKKSLTKIIARSLLKNSFNTSAWIFSTLIQMGEMTANSFLSPSLYFDMPSSSFEFFDKKTKKKNRPDEMTIRQSIRRLQKQGFVEKSNGKYALTKIGKDLAEYVIIRKKELKKKWDGKYRVVIFDIPETKRKTRDWLRGELCLLGYRKLQESVFIGKNSPTEDLIKEIKSLKIGNYVNYLLVNNVYKNIFE